MAKTQHFFNYQPPPTLMMVCAHVSRDELELSKTQKFFVAWLSFTFAKNKVTSVKPSISWYLHINNGVSQKKKSGYFASLAVNLHTKPSGIMLV